MGAGLENWLRNVIDRWLQMEMFMWCDVSQALVLETGDCIRCIVMKGLRKDVILAC